MYVHVRMNNNASRELVPPVRVIMWSAPRCLSSAFERSVRELKTVKVLYEPHQEAFWYGPERKSDANHPTAEDIVPGATFQDADQKLLTTYHGYDAVFAKNHAFYVEGRYEDYIEGVFSRFKHTFIIRHPLKSISSCYRACKKSGFTFLPSEAGFRQLNEFFQVVKKVDPSPVVVDADDLLARPREMMESYCSATGIDFQERMLTWTPGVVPDWAHIKQFEVWHEAAMKSSGFMKPAEATLSLSDYPEEVAKAVEYSLPFYEVMYKERTMLSQSA